MKADALRILGWILVPLGIVLVLSMTGWGVVAEATNHGYPHPGTLVVAGLVGLLSILGGCISFSVANELEEKERRNQ